MGYEIRLYIVRKTTSFDCNVNLRWAEKIAVFDLGKVPAVSDKMRAYSATDAFVYADDGNTEITEDDYGEPLTEIPVSDAITILENAAERDNYWRYKPCIALLKAVQEEKQKDVVVLHYGY